MRWRAAAIYSDGVGHGKNIAAQNIPLKKHEDDIPQGGGFGFATGRAARQHL